MKKEIADIIWKCSEEGHLNTDSAADQIISLIQENLPEEIDYRWEDGECSNCGYDSIINDDVRHACGQYNQAIDDMEEKMK